MEGVTQLTDQFSHASQLLAQGRWKEVDLRFDEAQRQFESSWAKIYEEFQNRPQEAPSAARMLIASQPLATSLSIAMARSDSVDLFNRFKRFLQFILRKTERLSGYPAIAGVPHVQAGFLYTAATVMALNWEAWNLLEKLLKAQFEWYYQSGRPIFNYAFDLPYLFHSEALGRSASTIHDFFRKELLETNIIAITGLAGESSLDAYIRAQMLMSLKVAQLREKGETISIWPDFGRFYAHRVIGLLDRAYADKEYASGLLRGFDEDSQTFFSRLNERLTTIRSVFWAGSQYFYESVTSWEPR